jgi:hypothetical protein
VRQPQPAQRLDRGGGVLERQQVLGLELVALAGREPHPEVREAVPPRSGDTELSRAVDRIELHDRVPLDGRGRRIEQRLRRRAALLEPDHVDPVQAREDADAVGGVQHLRDVLPAEALEDALGHLVVRLDVQGDAREHAEAAEVHDHAVEVGVATPHLHDVAGGGHELQRAYGGREVAGAGAVGAGGDRPRDRDVRERGEVVQRGAAVQVLGELAVGEAGVEAHAVAVDDDVGRHAVQRDVLVRVGQVIERVPGPERADGRRRGHHRPQLVECARAMHRPRPVGDVARPVLHSVIVNVVSSTVRRSPSHTTTKRLRANSG